VKRVEDILTGQRSFIELDAGLEKHARVVAEKIFNPTSPNLYSKWLILFNFSTP
jgi:hypothetical protein